MQVSLIILIVHVRFLSDRIRHQRQRTHHQKKRSTNSNPNLIQIGDIKKIIC